MTFVYRLGKEGETEAFLNDLKMVLLSPYEQSYKNDWYVPGRHGFLVSSYTLQGFLFNLSGSGGSGSGVKLKPSDTRSSAAAPSQPL